MDAPALARFILGASVAAFAAAGTAQAIPPPPPPPPVQVVAVSADFESEGFAEAYLQLIGHRGAFEREPSTVPSGPIEACARVTDGGAGDCIRTLLERDKIEGPIAVVLVRKGEGDAQSWTCIGTGDKPLIADRQQVEIDLKTGFFGEAGPKFEQFKLASGCVTAAAGESGW